MVELSLGKFGVLDWWSHIKGDSLQEVVAHGGLTVLAWKQTKVASEYDMEVFHYIIYRHILMDFFVTLSTLIDYFEVTWHLIITLFFQKKSLSRQNGKIYDLKR